MTDREAIIKELATALRAFSQTEDLPQNAITLWRAICGGIDRVADRLEELSRK